MTSKPGAGTLLFGYLPSEPPESVVPVLPRSPNGALGRAAAGDNRPVGADIIDRARERGLDLRAMNTSINRGKIAAALAGESVELPSGAEAAIFHELLAQQADLDASTMELRGKVSEYMATFEGLDVEDLSYIVKRIGRANSIVARLKTDLRPNIAATAELGEQAVNTKRMRSALCDEIADHMCSGGDSIIDVARACIAAARDPKARKVANGVYQPDAPARVDALLGIGNALLDAYRKSEDKSRPHLHRSGKLARPTSRITDDGKRVLLEWGAYGAAKCDAVVVNGVMSDAFVDEKFGEICDGLAEEFRVVCDNAALDNPDPEFAATARSWIRGVPLVGTLWALAGFPLVVPSHKLAASLMATYLPPEHASEVRPPWDTFFVAVPNGMFDSDNPKMLPRMVGLSTMGGGSMRLITVIGAGAMMRWESIGSIADLSDFAPELTSDEVAPLLPFLARLLLGCMIEMDHPERKAEIAERETARDASEKQRGGKKKSGPPSAWSFELKRDVRVDLRDWVREQVARGAGGGGGKRMSAVRILVRGHHKRQPYGIGGLLRKWIHVEAYWRGDDAAPVGVRSHVLKSGRDK